MLFRGTEGVISFHGLGACFLTFSHLIIQSWLKHKYHNGTYMPETTTSQWSAFLCIDGCLYSYSSQMNWHWSETSPFLLAFFSLIKSLFFHPTPNTYFNTFICCGRTWLDLPAAVTYLNTFICCRRTWLDLPAAVTDLAEIEIISNLTSRGGVYQVLFVSVH